MLLPIYGKEEKLFIQRIKNNLYTLEQEKDDLNYDHIIERYGLPTTVVYSYIDNLDTDVIMKKIHKKSLIKKIMISIITVVTVFSLFTLLNEIYEYKQAMNESREFLQKASEQAETIIIHE